MKARRLLSAAAIGGIALGTVACEGKLPSLNIGRSASAQKQENVDLGGPLFAFEEPPKASAPAASTTVQPDPIVVSNAQITVPKTENVPSKNNGALWQICTDVGAAANKDDIFVHPMDPNRTYRRLKEGDVVDKGQLVALLDDRQALAKYNAAKTDISAAQLALNESNNVCIAAQNTVTVLQNAGQSTSKLEMIKAQQEQATYKKNLAEAKGQYDKAIEAEKIAKVQLDEHELRSSIKGRIKTIYRKAGESIKELEPVLLIENLETLRIEGTVPVQYLPFLANAEGKKVLLEPAAQLGPQTELVGNNGVVTGVAISKDPKNPLIVTSSEDRTLRIWDRNTRFQKHALKPSGTPIRAVVCSGPKSTANVAVFGGDDGYCHILDLDNPTAPEADKKSKARHKGRINSVAISPEGTFAATADDKDIIVWNTASGEKVYEFSGEHRGPITYIQFTPQSKLVTVARDRSINLWELHEKGAKKQETLDNRSGNVDILGVSPDGQKIMFDQDRVLQVRGLLDHRTEAVLNQPSDSSQFTTFAVFSSDGQLVFTGGTHDNPLGVWRLPPPGSNQAYQRVRLALGNSTPVCISSSAAGGGFVVVGTNDHRVVVFARPENTEIAKQFEATITTIDPSIDSTDRRVRVWAELPNPGVPLIPGDSVTMVIPK